MHQQEFGIEDLRTHEKVDSTKVELRIFSDAPEERVHLFFVNPKRSGLTSHAHRASPSFIIRVDAERNARAATERLADNAYPFDFQLRLGMNFTDSLANDEFQLGFRFPGTGKDNPLRWTSSLSRLLKLARRGDLQSTALFQKESKKRRIRVGLYGIADRELGGQCVA